MNRAKLGEDLFESKRFESFIKANPSLITDKSNLDERLKEHFERSDSLYERDYDLNTIEILKMKTLREDPSFNRELPNLSYIIKQINLCHIIRKAYHIALKSDQTHPIEENKEETSNATSALLEAQDYKEMEKNNLYNQYLTIAHPVLRFLTKIFILFFQFQRIGFLLFANLVNIKLPLLRKSLHDYNLFTHLYNQITFKLKIMRTWPTLLAILNNKAQSSNYLFIFQAYTKLYSGLTFMIMDTLLGLIFTYVLYHNAQNLLSVIHSLFQGSLFI